jgi:hypothetical protein
VIETVPSDTEIKGEVNVVIAEDGFMIQVVMVRVPDEEREMTEAVCPDDGIKEREVRESVPVVMGKMVSDGEEREIIVLSLDVPQ